MKMYKRNKKISGKNGVFVETYKRSFRVSTTLNTNVKKKGLKASTFFFLRFQ